MFRSNLLLLTVKLQILCGQFDKIKIHIIEYYHIMSSFLLKCFVMCDPCINRSLVLVISTCGIPSGSVGLLTGMYVSMSVFLGIFFYNLRHSRLHYC